MSNYLKNNKSFIRQSNLSHNQQRKSYDYEKFLELLIESKEKYALKYMLIVLYQIILIWLYIQNMLISYLKRCIELVHLCVPEDWHSYINSNERNIDIESIRKCINRQSILCDENLGMYGLKEI